MTTFDQPPLPGLDPATVATIRSELASIEREERVAIPLAIESGSRAWGFPSPDSDYDCRFLYVRRREAYLALYPPRDVIEPGFSGDLDVNGWDIRKALRLLLRGNAVLIEWLTSPLAYRVDRDFRRILLDLAAKVARRDLIARHYLHLGLRQYRTYFGSGLEDVALKKVFYALRPAAALRWLRLHPDTTVAPMHFPTLLAECEPPADLAAIVGELLSLKARTRELGAGPMPPPVAAFIEAEYAAAATAFPDDGRVPDPRSVAAADACFLALLDRYG